MRMVHDSKLCSGGTIENKEGAPGFNHRSVKEGAFAERARRRTFASHVAEECDHYFGVPARQRFAHRDTSIFNLMPMLITNGCFCLLKCLRSFSTRKQIKYKSNYLRP